MKRVRQTRHEHIDRLGAAISATRGALWAAAGLSFAINLLMLTGPLFMLQVYDRVLASGSVPTLAALFALVVGLYGFMGLFDFLRSRILSRIGFRIDDRLSAPAMRSWIENKLAARERPGRPLNDLASLRTFLGSTALPALFDLPWAPIYLAIVFLLHMQLGMLALVGAGVVVVMAFVNEWMTRRPSAEAARQELGEQQVAEDSHRTAEAIVAMGMTRHVIEHWSRLRASAGERAQCAAERGESLAAASKAFRLLLQSAILALGAYLAMRNEITPGTIIAASILAGRALAPIDQTIGNWRNIERARQAYARLAAHLLTARHAETRVDLPPPKGALVVEKLVKFVPGETTANSTPRPILHGIGFALEPGDGLGVIGHSAAGKSTLARLLVGLWAPDQGSVRLDGATREQWHDDELGRHIGYLPQAVELIAGTIRQNICRFDANASDEDVVAAAQLAGVHEMILKLPDGYGTEIGSGRPPLSGGQAQRIGLARAVFGRPALVVLDEPSSNLDADGDAALTRAIESLRASGSTVVVMTHRPSAIAAVNLLLILKEGRQVEFGDKTVLLRKGTRAA